MVRLVKEWDPLFFEKVGAGVIEPADVTEAAFPRPRSGGDCYAAEFDARLNGRWSRLRDASPDAEEIVAESVRSVFGLTAGEMSDDEALDRVMNPARNRYRLDILNVSYHSPLMRALHHATYVFEKRLSHTADSQDQRHRLVPASRPLLTFADTRAARLITPRGLIAATTARQRGVSGIDGGSVGGEEPAAGAPACRSSSRSTSCPTAKTLRFVESGRSLALLHKWTLRTCFNAQEEIYLASMDELAQVRAAHLRIWPPHRAAVSSATGSSRRGAPGERISAACRRGKIFPPRFAGSDGAHRRAMLIAAWLVHLYTASGFVLAFLAAQAAIEHDFRSAFLYLFAQVLVDATDGLLARTARVSERLPWFSGSKLDDLVDYLTYVSCRR
jgi:hypothetical protein